MSKHEDEMRLIETVVGASALYFTQGVAAERVKMASAACETIRAALDAAAAANAEHEKFVADVLHIRGEIEWLDEECRAMREALTGLLDRYTALVNCGDCGHWDPEKEAPVIAARAALSMPRVVRDPGKGLAEENAEQAADNKRLRGSLEEMLELAKQYLNETGGCDHSVNICVCDIKGHIEGARAALAPKETE